MSNLRPICSLCNRSMGSMFWNDFTTILRPEKPPSSSSERAQKGVVDYYTRRFDISLFDDGMTINPPHKTRQARQSTTTTYDTDDEDEPLSELAKRLKRKKKQKPKKKKVGEIVPPKKAKKKKQKKVQKKAPKSKPPKKKAKKAKRFTKKSVLALQPEDIKAWDEDRILAAKLFLQKLLTPPNVLLDMTKKEKMDMVKNELLMDMVDELREDEAFIELSDEEEMLDPRTLERVDFKFHKDRKGREGFVAEGPDGPEFYPYGGFEEGGFKKDWARKIFPPKVKRGGEPIGFGV